MIKLTGVWAKAVFCPISYYDLTEMHMVNG